MLRALDDLIEQRIREAQREGQFDDLPGAGRPLVIDDEPLVPEALRVAWRVLKNAGCVPAEVAAMKEIGLLMARSVEWPGAAGGPPRAGAADPSVASIERRAERRLLALTIELESQGMRLATHNALAYRRAILRKLESKRGE